MTETTRLADLNALEAAGPLWRELQDACEHQHVMMDHRWVLSWWRHFGAGKAQHTVVVSSGRTPVGIAPLAITRGFEAYPFRDAYLFGIDDYPLLPALRFKRFVPLRRLAFPLNVASANTRGQAIFPDPEPGLYAALGRYCAENARSWDVATLSGLRVWEHEDATLQTEAKDAGLKAGTRRDERKLLYIDLPSSFAEYLRTRTAHFRSRLNGQCNKLERSFAALGRMQIDCLRGPDFASGLERMFALEKTSWKVATEKDRRLHLALDERTRGFFREVGTRFAADDQAQVLILKFGDTDAAGMFTLERRGVAVGVVTYRNEHLGETVGVAPLWRQILDGYIARGLIRFDVNGYTRNYLKWASGEHSYGRALLFNRNPYSRLLHAVDEGALAVGRRLTVGRGAASVAATTASLP